MWRGWLLAAIAAFVVIGALKLADVIWTSAPPKWVTTLGTGVTVTGPEQLVPRPATFAPVHRRSMRLWTDA
jgi:acyl-coenzyme A synthetase/AMP-(fatty) acid ligase